MNQLGKDKGTGNKSSALSTSSNRKIRRLGFESLVFYLLCDLGKLLDFIEMKILSINMLGINNISLIALLQGI